MQVMRSSRCSMRQKFGAAGAADDGVHLVALLEQQLGEIGAVLAGDAGDQCAFGHELIIILS